MAMAIPVITMGVLRITIPARLALRILTAILCIFLVFATVTAVIARGPMSEDQSIVVRAYRVHPQGDRSAVMSPQHAIVQQAYFKSIQSDPYHALHWRGYAYFLQDAGIAPDAADKASQLAQLLKPVVSNDLGVGWALLVIAQSVLLLLILHPLHGRKTTDSHAESLSIMLQASVRRQLQGRRLYTDGQRTRLMDFITCIRYGVLFFIFLASCLLFSTVFPAIPNEVQRLHDAMLNVVPLDPDFVPYSMGWAASFLSLISLFLLFVFCGASAQLSGRFHPFVPFIFTVLCMLIFIYGLLISPIADGFSLDELSAAPVIGMGMDSYSIAQATGMGISNPSFLMRFAYEGGLMGLLFCIPLYSFLMRYAGRMIVVRRRSQFGLWFLILLLLLPAACVFLTSQFTVYAVCAAALCALGAMMHPDLMRRK